jgi:hypothetical protein
LTGTKNRAGLNKSHQGNFIKEECCPKSEDIRDSIIQGVMKKQFYLLPKTAIYISIEVVSSVRTN